MKKWVPYILFVVGILACCAVSYFIGYDKGFKNAPIEEKVDTVMVRETLTVYEPQEVIKYKDKIVYIPVTDSVLVHHHDTTYIALQSERKVYQDEDYRAVVSGIYPKLEEISVYPKTITIMDTKTIRKRWGWAIAAGPSVLYNGSVHAGIGLTAGFSYNF